MAKSQPLVSVIVPCYKMGRYVSEALQSVASQTYQRWEVIVVDDCGPDDGTEEAVTAFRTRWPNHRVEYLRHAQNLGVSATRNTAIATAQGDFFAFLDPDDLWYSNHLRNCIAAFLADEAVAVVTAPVEVFWDKELARSPTRLNVEKWKTQYFPESLAIHNFIQPSATLVKRNALVDAGGFDVTPGLQHIEDYDLWIRLAAKGYRFIFLDEVTAGYRKHPSAATADLEKDRHRNNAIRARHIGFFISMQGKLIQDLYEEIEITNQELMRLREALRNPIRWLINQGRKRLTANASNRRGREHSSGVADH
jgi:glycosyltransferase involved in cell wall biosynthesis